jgi:pimeloyl-ACP methyl ester carboxylesterase
MEKLGVLRGLMDLFDVMWPQMLDTDFRRDVTHLEVPVYFLDAEHELDARRDLALEWFDLLEAPIKRVYTFENAGHSVAFEQFEALSRILNDTVLPETYTSG